MNSEKKVAAPFNRGTGLLIIEVRQSNPNGDPDEESRPRQIDDGRGLISPVSFKRKLRDLVADKDASAWMSAKEVLSLESEKDKRTFTRNTHRGIEDEPTDIEVKGKYMGEKSISKQFNARYDILETRFRRREEIEKLDAFQFAEEFWDARIFGNTFLESLKDGDGEKDGDDENEGKSKAAKEKHKKKLEEREKRDHFINTGVVQFGTGISVAPISVVEKSWTNKAGVEKGKVQGLAPLAWRVVNHAVYVMPFFVNPQLALKTGCGLNDLRLMQFMIPLAYRLTASVPRTHVEILHAWYAEHKSPLGSCPDSLIIDALTPKKTEGNVDEASTSIEEYQPIPEALPDVVKNRLENFDDLCVRQWEK